MNQSSILTPGVSEPENGAQRTPSNSWTFRPDSVVGELLRQPGAFDFFQAVSLIERVGEHRGAIGQTADPANEPLRFRAAMGAAFPSSAISEVLPATDTLPQAEMTVAMFGLTGPSGVLPRHYTQLLERIQRDARGTEKHALRDWFDLFNHRLISQFYRAWKKYRCFTDPAHVASERSAQGTPFATVIFSFAGLGLPQLQNRLQVTTTTGDVLSQANTTLGRISDLSLQRYAGLLAQRPRTAGNLKQLLRDYFQLPVEVQQFQGQWLSLEREHQTRLSDDRANNQLGVTAIAGSQVWDIQSKFRLRLGPIGYEQFNELLPDPSPTELGKSFFLICQLTRLFVGPEFDFDIQLVLDRNQVPACQLSADKENGSRLGWNTWLCNETPQADADDAYFESVESL